MSEVDIEAKLASLKELEPLLVTEEDFLPEQMASAKESHAVAHQGWLDKVTKLESQIADLNAESAPHVPDES
tara:strand:- start:588 stop:803 length:216 start_codon:yes stop_codon:yes gene_type:complete